MDDVLLAELEGHGVAFADAVTRLGLDTKVPTCPGWNVRDLVVHVGDVHRRITRYVAEARPERLPPGQRDATAPADDALAAWSRAGLAELLRTLEDAAPDLECYVLYPADAPRSMWIRRMAHETAIHRVDLAEAAGSSAVAFSPPFAVDGVDELLTGIARPGRRPTAPEPFTMVVSPDDADAAWTVRVGADADYAVTRTDGAGDARLTGCASALYRLLWNRPPAGRVEAHGDADLLTHWRGWQP